MAVAGQSVTIVLADAVDASRGTLLVSPREAALVSERLDARMFCIGDVPLQAGATVLLKLGAATATATVETIRRAHRSGYGRRRGGAGRSRRTTSAR